MEKIIQLTPENIAEEHICCSFSNKKCIEGYEAKKNWLTQQMKEGFVFKKFDIRGKVFIEYVPAENAWCPIEAPGYMMINCFWVSGQYKGKGYGKKLYEECVKDAAGMNGIIIVSSDKKQPFMSDKKFFINQGFEVCDKVDPYFELLYKPFNKDAPIPRFKDCTRTAQCDFEEGIAVYYTNGCPFTEYYVAELGVVASERGYPFHAVKITNKEQAQNHFVPFTNYSLFQDGKFITQHIVNEGYFSRFIK